jgi:hypothetical protein
VRPSPIPIGVSAPLSTDMSGMSSSKKGKNFHNSTFAHAKNFVSEGVFTCQDTKVECKS